MSPSTSEHCWALGHNQMPLADRPLQPCRQYPRVANRLALTWQDGVLTKRVLESLPLDKRGGRRGFSKEVAADLATLAAQVAQAPGDAAQRLSTALQKHRE